MKIKGIMKRAAAVLLAASLSLGLMTGCGKKTPMQTIESGAENLVTNITDDYSVINTLSDALNGGSIQINMPLDGIIEMLSGMDINGINAALTLFFGEGDIAMNAAALLNGVSVADADLYIDKTGFAVSSDELLGKNIAYGSDFTGIEERFENSIFAGDGPYSEYADVLGQVAGVLSYAGQAMGIIEDVETCWQVIKDDVYAAIEENSDCGVENSTYAQGDSSIKTQYVSIVAENGQFSDMMTAVCDVLLSSTEFKNICKDYDELLEALGVSDLYDSVKDLKQKAGDYNDNKLEIYAHVGKSSKELISLEVKLSGADFETTEFKFVCTDSSKDMKNVLVSYGAGSDLYEFDYRVKESTKNSYKSELGYREKVDGNENTRTLFVYSWNKTSGDFKLKLLDDEYTLKGDITAEKTKSVINVESFEILGLDLQFEIVINAVADMPVIEDYDDILTVDEAEFEEILEPIIGLVDDFTSGIGS